MYIYIGYIFSLLLSLWVENRIKRLAYGTDCLCCSQLLHRLSDCAAPPGLGSRDLLHDLRTPCSFFSRETLCTSSRMFRTRRSGLVRRLWRSRAPVDGDGEEAADAGTHGAGGSGRGNGSLCMGKATKAAGGGGGGGGGGASAEAELKALTHSVLKKIKEKQLEVLLQAVESKGGARSPCLMLPGRVDAYSLPLLLFKVFRWPDLRHWSQLKRLPCCESYGKINPELVCCNPHHMSRLCEPGKTCSSCTYTLNH